MTAPLLKQMTTVNLEQGSDPWHDYRKNKMGASEVANLFNANPFTQAQDQTKYLIGLKLGFNEIFTNAAMIAGNDNESDIIDAVENKYDIVTQPLIGYIDNISASFDGITLDNDLVVEVKYSKFTYDYVLKNQEVPKHYHLQVQQQMLVSGANKAIFAVMHTETRDVIMIEVEADTELQKEISEKIEAFFKLMESKEWKEEDFNEERDDLDWLQAVENYKDALSIEQEAKNAKTIAKDELIKLSDGIRSKGGGCSVYPSKGRETVNYKQIIKDNEIEILDKYKKQGAGSWGVRVTDK